MSNLFYHKGKNSTLQIFECNFLTNLDLKQRYCNICMCLLDRLDMERHRQSKQHCLNYIIDEKMNNLPIFTFEPVSGYIPSSTRVQEIK